jgi:enoyl-CoA hydratase/carnithine racemase
MSDPLVRIEVTGDVATITLDSPSNRNALSRALVNELHNALDRVEATAARVIVLTHTGPVFCAGADLKERLAETHNASTPVAHTSRDMTGVLQRLMSSPRPTIAVVRGPVRAGGIGVMAACDLVAVAPDVTFAFTEVRIGVAPAIISVPIVKRVSATHLTVPFLTGEVFDAPHAAAIGLVNAVGDPDALAHRWCEGILAAAPGAVAATKSLLMTVPGRAVDEAFAEMTELSLRLFDSDEGREGMAAFAERRPPRWAHKDH